jgi:hypothetical protein
MPQATLQQQQHQQLDQSKHRIDKNDVNLLNFILRRSGGKQRKEKPPEKKEEKRTLFIV